MGADKSAAVFDDEDNEGRKTGYSTPGYLKEGEDPEAAERRNNLNVCTPSHNFPSCGFTTSSAPLLGLKS